MDRPRGLELLFKLFQNDVTSKEDLLVIVVHSLFINKLGHLAGLGDKWSNEDEKTELLPEGWNSNQELYTLRYISTDSAKKYLVKVASAGENLILTILDIVSEDVNSLSFNVNQYISEYGKDYSRAYQNLSDMSKKFDDMVAHFQKKDAPKKNTPKEEFPKVTSDAESKKSEERTRPFSLQDNRNFRPLPDVGRADLDPFSGGYGGGMLFDHRSQPRGQFSDSNFPRGVVPPGARFDPMNPFVGRFQVPDPDHLPPPGYDDMFM